MSRNHQNDSESKTKVIAVSASDELGSAMEVCPARSGLNN